MSRETRRDGKRQRTMERSDSCGNELKWPKLKQKKMIYLKTSQRLKCVNLLVNVVKISFILIKQI